MSHPARDPQSGIDGKASAAGGRHADAGTMRCLTEAARMSHPARDPRSGIDGNANAAGGRGVARAGLALADGVGPSVRTGRVRSRVKTGTDEKVKKPADGAHKKSPPLRKAPARGRYVDEYARPAR
jgi:hypothetical protein